MNVCICALRVLLRYTSMLIIVTEGIKVTEEVKCVTKRDHGL